ncbi:hypothetical protein PR202_gb26011 [Eleusine coracana subsp. coracana]|uniref:Uncharacterized protein n=1 Tax=Eleusine coracana subsp. coracana TaxID=191504 RepID=A0AAV5FMZ3_ELECO|nr:hypothetical protein PR202_gb26011 [Eleusine coracana subsp. coracana]
MTMIQDSGRTVVDAVEAGESVATAISGACPKTGTVEDCVPSDEPRTSPAAASPPPCIAVSDTCQVPATVKGATPPEASLPVVTPLAVATFYLS